MVEILDKDKIDELFLEIDPEGSSDEPQEEKTTGRAVGSAKIVRIPKKVVPRSYNPYRSPVVKAGAIIMDPDGDVDSGPRVVVVRTPENFARLRKQRWANETKERI